MGNMLLAAPKPATSGTNLLPFLIIAVLFVLLYMTMIRPQRNRQRRAMQMQSDVTPGQQIRTTSGMYGTVTAVQDGDVEVEVAPGVRIRMLRRAVMDVVSGDGAGYGTTSGEQPGQSADTSADDAAGGDVGAQDRTS
jgi:preprotein translocase subunit YajC